MSHDFRLVNFDTDSIMVCKKDGSEFSEEERDNLLMELNSLFPAKIHWEDDGYYPNVYIARTKNYLLYDGEKVKIKGSALKATTKEKALQEFIKRMAEHILFGGTDCVAIYDEYVKEAMNVRDITRWVSKKTVTDKVLKSDRRNESNVRDALEGSEYVEGDKVYMYYREDGTLQLVERFDGEYDKLRLLKKLFDTSKVFETVLPEGTFINYSLKRSQGLLSSLLTGSASSS